MQGLLAFRHQFLSKNHPVRPRLEPAYWNGRVLEMEVVDSFGNRIALCEFATLPYFPPPGTAMAYGTRLFK
jgi:hypothetical protein